jgi:hypothetical protein
MVVAKKKKIRASMFIGSTGHWRPCGVRGRGDHWAQSPYCASEHMERETLKGIFLGIREDKNEKEINYL